MGIKGYLERNASSSSLRQAIQAIQHGNVWIEHEVMKHLIQNLDSVLNKGASEAWSDGLTLREKETAHSLLKGKSNKEIAEIMNISERTVKSHLRNLFDKFEVNDRLALVVKIQESK